MTDRAISYLSHLVDSPIGKQRLFDARQGWHAFGVLGGRRAASCCSNGSIQKSRGHGPDRFNNGGEASEPQKEGRSGAIG